jgi:hypothetical protein
MVRVLRARPKRGSWCQGERGDLRRVLTATRACASDEAKLAALESFVVTDDIAGDFRRTPAAFFCFAREWREGCESLGARWPE